VKGRCGVPFHTSEFERRKGRRGGERGKEGRFFNKGDMTEEKHFSPIISTSRCLLLLLFFLSLIVFFNSSFLKWFFQKEELSSVLKKKRDKEEKKRNFTRP
jgi:hypothetical protein